MTHPRPHPPTRWPWRFFAIAYGWSWLFLIPAALSGLGADAFPVPVLRVLAGLGPAASALWLLYRTARPLAHRDYWRRLVSPARIGRAWAAVTVLTVPLLTGLSALVDLLLGGDGLCLEAAARLVHQPAGILPFILFVLLFGPLPEEMGWRGYALDALQATRTALASSLILGAAWALWHLPLFFIEGTYQAGLGVGTGPFWTFLLVIVPQSVIMTWIYNHTHCSTLSAVLLHFMVNFTGELFALSWRAEVILLAAWTLLAVVVIVVWGGAHLRRRAADVPGRECTT